MEKEGEIHGGGVQRIQESKGVSWAEKNRGLAFVVQNVLRLR